MGGACSSVRKSTAHRTANSPSTSTNICFIDAAAQGDLDQLALLLARGANVNFQDRSGRTALHLACCDDHREAVRFLISQRANVDECDCFGNSPIKEAIVHGQKDLVEVLIKAGAQVSAHLLADLETRLIEAASYGRLEEVRRLVENGVFLDAVDSTGKTGLHVASENGHGGIVDFLISKGADVRIKDKASNTALDLATRKTHEHVVMALRNADKYCRGALKNTSASSNNAANFALMEAFPHTIAAAMLEGREPEPIKRCSVSLLFSDMCGFTAISSHMDPSKLSSLINRIFRKFDRLAHLHCVQKVNTVGDAYIAATNLLEDQPDDHAARLARFACDMLAAARTMLIDEEDPAGGCVSIRVGLHCGPVEGFVVGAHSGRYTLMGEAVNVAAAMEQSGAAGRAQCSAAFAELVGAQGHAVTLHRR